MTPPTPIPLLARIREAHPEWLDRVAHESHADALQRPAFRILLPSADRRPDVEIAFHETEALVRVGLHEQLFVWSSEEADEAVEEVIGYVERITRSDLSASGLRRGLETLTDEQRELLARVDRRLRERGAVSEIEVRGPAREPHGELRLLLPPERRLEVTIRIGTDGLELDADGAVLRVDRVDFGDDGPTWLDGCGALFRRLLAHDLTLRTRRTLTGRRVGAIHVPTGEEEGFWSGELLACLGLGRTRTVPRWWSAE
ncbi:MAG TPA: hypothetical protein VLL48_01140 [Longimicrobiales bacterium]|nr:hypothetical protein [Longimicrobiales bacterium]